MRIILLRSAVLAALAAVVFAIPSQAQTDYSYRSATNFLTVGVGFLGGVTGSVKDPPEGTKIAPVFGYKFGVNGMYPLSSVTSVTLDLGLDSRGNKQRNYTDPDVYVIDTYKYFSITPGVRLSSFWMGLNLGVPLSGVHTAKSGSGSVPRDIDFTTKESDSIAFMVEGRLGVSIPVVDEKTWWLGLNFSIGYCFNNLGTYSEGTVGYNPPLASAHLGFTVQYAIPKTGRR